MKTTWTQTTEWRDENKNLVVRVNNVGTGELIIVHFGDRDYTPLRFRPDDEVAVRKAADQIAALVAEPEEHIEWRDYLIKWLADKYKVIA